MRIRNLVMMLLVLVVSTPALAGSVTAGKAKSGTCAGCHGPMGKSVNPQWPHLAGQQEAYLAKQLRDFRDGNRQDPVMSPMAAPLSDQDIEDLAAFFASLK